MPHNPSPPTQIEHVCYLTVGDVGTLRSVCAMKFNTKNPLHSVSRNETDYSPAYTPEALAAAIREQHPEMIQSAQAVMHHPRSLSRPTAAWRPPVVTLPRVANGPQLTLAVTRRRVGPRARARIQGYGGEQIPAYLIEVRIADTTGALVDTVLTEAWVRAIIPNDCAHAVHELAGTRTANYVWLVDGAFHPIASPSSMFEGLSAA